MYWDKKILVFCGMCVFVAINCISIQETQAAKCGEFTSDDNQSLYEACDCNGACGTMWLSDKGGAYDISSTITVSESEVESGSKTVYLHGAILHGGGSVAGYVWISEGSTRIRTYQDYYNAQMFSGFSSGKLWDLWKNGMYRVGNYYPYSNNIESSVVSLSLDLNEIQRKYGRKTNYDIPIQIFRCFEGFRPYDNTPSNCYSNTSHLNISIPTNSNPSVSYVGKTRVLGTSDLSVGWDNWTKGDGWFLDSDWSDKVGFDSDLSNIIDCSATDGCYAQFRHYLWASKWGSQASYLLHRTIERANGAHEECYGSELGQDGNGNMSGCTKDQYYSHTINNVNDTFVDKSYVKLMPGDKVCDEMEFHSKSKNGTSGYSDLKTIRACVTAKPAPSGDTYEANLSTKVRNSSLGTGNTYGNYQEETYVKPGDDVTYAVEYDPAPQRAYDLKPNRFRINNGTIINNTFGQTAHALFRNDKNNNYLEWLNIFYIQGDLTREHLFDPVDSGYSNKLTEQYTVNNVGTVGSTYVDRAVLNLEAEEMKIGVTPSKVSIIEDGGGTLMNVFTDKIESNEVKVYVPYNFENSVEFTANDGTIPVGGGDIGYKLVVGDKQNNVTGRSYATPFKDAKWKITSTHGELSAEGDKCSDESVCMEGDLDAGDNKESVHVNLTEDLPAGTEVCVTVELTPVDSGDDKNLTPDGFSWGSVSATKCFKVAKKPNFQVWGGSIYSNGSIDLGGYTVKKVGEANPLAFGSWTELSLQAKGNVIGLASGAALSKGMELSSGTVNDCSINPLSFENVDCEAGNIGNSGVDINDRDGLADKLRKLNLEEPDSLALSCNDGACTLGGGSMQSGIRFIDRENSNLTISGNITYDSDGVNMNVDDMPKLFIYANNINIGCEVARIDAVLIAEGSVSTCGSTDYDSQDNSHQLKINGAVIANELILNRTYGATTGREGSATPAEIINYDPTLYVWGNTQSEGSSNGGYSVEVVWELPPRF